jgi:hypothetical protein
VPPISQAGDVREGNYIFDSTISTFQLFELFPDAEAARVYMEGKRWPHGAVCPACDEGQRITARKGGFYRCNACKNRLHGSDGYHFRAVPYPAA